MAFKLHIKPNEIVADYYKNHTTFHKGDSGLDLFCPEDIEIKPNETATIRFGISCEANRSYWLIPRSSISKTPLRMANSIGLIDVGYRGEIMAKVDNIKTDTFTIKKGTRLFQIASPTLDEINFTIVSELSETTRGEGGFGSTGI